MSLLPRRRDEEDQKTFWIEFQVCHDGLSPTPTPDPTSPSSPPPPPPTFTLFPLLPFELRHKVWAHLLQPRIVIATCLDADDAARKRAQLARRPRLPATPVLLHVCRETRRLAQRRYGPQPSLAWRVPAVVATRPRSAGPRVWFDFDRDALLLLGELEPYDRSGVNAPMAYFLDRADARRVRHVACAFEELRLGDVEGEQVFGTLFHVVDAFPRAERLVITSTDEDVAAQKEARGGLPLDFGLGTRENLVQKIWWGWVNGTSVVTSQLRDKQILMVREDGLADFVAEHI